MRMPGLDGLQAMAGEGFNMLLCALILASTGPQPMAARLTAVQEAYRQGGAMTAEFTQTYYDALRPRAAARSESGHVVVDAAGRVRWSYLRPEEKVFIFDGDTGFFYEPAQKQVTQHAGFGATPLGRALPLLWGRGEVAKLYEVRACPPAGAGGDGVLALPAEVRVPSGELCVQLAPRQHAAQQGAVAQVILGIDEAGRRIRRALIVDPLGNINEIVFAQVARGQAVSEDLFVFRPPPDVSVLDARAP